MPQPPATEPPLEPAPSSPAGAQQGAAPAAAATAAPLLVVRERARWRLPLLAALLGIVVGAIVPGGVGALERASAQARSDSLRTLATAYLQAIADGRSDDATALVPLPPIGGPALPWVADDAVLQSADRIEGAAVPFVLVEGDAGVAVVRYRLDGRYITRTLEAERLDAGWSLTTSLAEPVSVVRLDELAPATVAGVQLGFAVHLYPGGYEFDLVRGELVDSGGDPFWVDGDRSTPSQAYVGSRLAPAVEERIDAVVVSTVAACQARPACPISPGTVVSATGDVELHGVDSSTGAIDIGVRLELLVAGERRSTELEMRIEPGIADQPDRWLCSQPGIIGGELGACVP